MQVTKEGIERIKSANDLAAVVAERGIELKKKGKQLVAPCPFHEEKTASFNVSSAKGLYHCFGCGASGDVIGFVTKHDKVSFGGALETLARRAGLDLERLMEERPRIQQRTPLAALTPPRNGKPPLRRPRPRARPSMARRHCRTPARSSPASSSTTTGPSASGRTRRRTSSKRGLTDTRSRAGARRSATRTARS